MTSAGFLLALRYRESFEPAKGELISWPLGIARRCVANAVRSKATNAVGDTERPDGAGGS